MADDKQSGDDLFEDLDKFFAPIRDVDWDAEEPAPPASEPPHEEHVSVHAGAPAVPAEPAELSEPEPPAPARDQEDETLDEAWYDTGVLEPIEELLGEP
ncbi:MAG TPA: hypothetical protein VIE12_06900, partial [Actinomycetota bacterium]